MRSMRVGFAGPTAVSQTETNLALRLKRLEALEAIRTCIFSYAAAGDRNNDPAVVERLFAEDGSYEAVGMAKFVGRAEVARGLAEIGRTAVLWAFHAPGGPLIEIAEDAERARAFWWVWCPVVLAEGDGTSNPVWGAGHYNADLVAVDGTWKFKRVVFATKLRTPFEGPWTQIDGDFEWLV